MDLERNGSHDEFFFCAFGQKFNILLDRLTVITVISRELSWKEFKLVSVTVSSCTVCY